MDKKKVLEVEPGRGAGRFHKSSLIAQRL